MNRLRVPLGRRFTTQLGSQAASCARKQNQKNMTQLKITTNLHGQMDSASRAGLHSFFQKTGGIFGKDLADAALSEIQREIQQHVAAHRPKIRFMSVADFCAKPVGSSLFGVPEGLSTLAPGMTMRPVESSSLRR